MTSFQKRAVEGVDRALQPGAQEAPPNLIYVPTTPLDVGFTAGTAVGAPWAFGKLVRQPISLARSAALGFGPIGVPFSGMTDIAGMLAGPIVDPKYHAGELSYPSAVRETARRHMKAIGEGSADVRRRYGLAGIPVQAVHGLFNPVSSALYLAKSLREYLSTKEGQDDALSAEHSIAAALEG